MPWAKATSVGFETKPQIVPEQGSRGSLCPLLQAYASVAVVVKGVLGQPAVASPYTSLPSPCVSSLSPLNDYLNIHTQRCTKSQKRINRYTVVGRTGPGGMSVFSSGDLRSSSAKVSARLGTAVCGWHGCTQERDMPAPPSRRRSFLTLPTTREDDHDRPRGLKTHRSLASVRTAMFERTSSSSSSHPTPAAEQQPQARGFAVRRMLGTVALVLISFAAGSWSGCGENNNGNGAAYPPGIDFHPNGYSRNISAGLAPQDARHRPFYDLVVAVLAVGGDSPEAQEEIARVRRVYARYGSEVVPGGPTSSPLTFRVVFVVGRVGLSEDVELPGAGLLLGDFYHVDVREGYTYLSDKTRAMAGLAEHLR